ncbi:MAG: monovalent cation/H+ antiporter complex subunit F [Trueperella sp.]|uniref:monovalent cation/H+ antiporter complex subunit F n=1 Tax=Trueperella sp. TaxID=2699835 RepID=UPI002A90A461|nr:monovalent cation/H+ antiporter complex subunit F [Trueperella sp.]MDY5403414.1 monovalent cation/H+ antiporter complex subunit F [Trueperella sp.]
MTYLLGACMALLFVAALLVLMRIFRGPTALERMVALDVMTSVVIGAVALLAALTRRADLLALFVALSLVGFVGSTTLARFLAPSTGGKRLPDREGARQGGAGPGIPARGETGRTGVVDEGRRP